MNKYLKIAKDQALLGIKNEEGGPFGAVITRFDEVIAKGNNQVLLSHDPTAHAEIVAIREASKKLNTHDLSSCTLYTTCEPCPMCLSAIIWANIKTVYYACTKEDAKKIGFRDDDIYEFIKGNNEMLKLIKMDREECLEIMEQWEENNGKLY